MIDSNNLRETITYFSSFNTRNTNSAELDRAVLELKERFDSIPNLSAELFSYPLEPSRRVPESKVANQVIATLKGETDRIILVGAHLDSLNITEDPLSGIAPGANDDLSGIAVVMECARILSQYSWHNTIKFVAFTGEEQGLLGAKALANFAKESSWDIAAVLNLDTIGSSKNSWDEENSDEVRLFSGQESQVGSKELGRLIDWLSKVPELATSEIFDASLLPAKGNFLSPTTPKFGVKLVQRLDRFGRGGDHIPFHNLGYASVRFIEVCEDITVQHTVDDTVDRVDFNYLAKVARLVLLSLSYLGQAQSECTNIRILRRVSPNTSIKWNGSMDQPHVILWRDTRNITWQGWSRVDGALECTIEGINKDDYFYGISSLGNIPIEANQISED